MTKPSDIIGIASFSFDLRSEVLTDPKGRAVALRPQTARVLAVLAAQAGALVTKDALMAEVWADTHVTDDSLVQCISEIRRALGPEGGGLVKTVPKQGYRLDVTALAAAAPPPSRARRGTVAVLAVLLALLAASAAGFWATRPAPGRPEVTLAVLPFSNIGDDPAQDYMTVGLAEDLRTDLARVGGLTVLSGSATNGLAGSPDAAQALYEVRGVTHVIDGSLQRDGDRLRIRVALIDATTGASLWAERYDRAMGDIFAVQDDVRARIFSALAVRLAPGAEERLKAGRTQLASAYDLFLQGRYAESTLNRQGVTRAAALYGRAIALDPSYAEARARLANMLDFQARFGWTDDPATARAQAIEMAKSAVRLDPRSAFAHWTLGRVVARLGQGRAAVEQATAEFKAAIALDPNYADAYGFLALVLVGDGKADEAAQAIGKAFLLNPEPPAWYFQNRGIVAYFGGDFAAAAADFETAAARNPTASYVHLWTAAAYAMAGRTDDAEWEADEARTLGSPAQVGQIVTANSVIRHPAFRASYAEGLRRAGLPD